MIKITDGKNKTKTYKEDLKAYGLRFKPTGKYTGYWYTTDDSQKRILEKYCKENKLVLEYENDKYMRSPTYREDFFRVNKGYKKNGKDYHCAYCGRKLTKQKLEVDHVIAINAVRKRLMPRFWIWFLNINNVNDPKNLVASCKSCNRRKSDKQGLWVLIGFLGRHIWFWRIFRVIILLIIFYCILYTLSYMY